MRNIHTVDKDNTGSNANLQSLPDECPLCGVSIEPKTWWSGYLTNVPGGSVYLQVTFSCPRHDCQNLFIGYYCRFAGSSSFNLLKTAPVQPKGRSFSAIIYQISPKFPTIFNQALVAEHHGLLEVCGAGYRKALEFLIKDYLVRQLGEETREKITNKKLYACIMEDIVEDDIKIPAQRATWIGNDETHYYRQWENHDISDLKEFIEMTINWIELKERNKKLTEEMPDKKVATPK